MRTMYSALVALSMQRLVLILMFAAVAIVVFGRHFGVSDKVSVVLETIAFGCAAIFLTNGFRINRVIAKQRSRRGAGLCTYCAYDLRSLSSNRCPECGKSVQLFPKTIVREDEQSE